MIDPVFLTLDHVLQFHDDVLAADGGAEGLRDRGLLDSAVHAPQASYGGTWLVGDRDDQRLDDTVLAVAVGTFRREDASRVLREVAGAT